jgi:DNA polymerase epsilon subunit 2
MYRQRLLLGQQRLLRGGLVRLRGMDSNKLREDERKMPELSSIESLLGSTGTRVLFGMITQPEEGCWYLEDLTANIKLNLIHAQTTTEIYTENSLVILQGHLENGIFMVETMILPPYESRKKAVEAMGVRDPFGNNNTENEITKQNEMEIEKVGEIFIIISDVCNNIYLTLIATYLSC